VAALWPYVSDEAFPRHMSWAAHRDPAETAEFIAAMVEAREAETGFVWAIVHEGALVGLIGLEGIVRVSQAWRFDRAELGYWVGPPFQNRGLVTEAGREVLRFGFDDLGLHKIIVGCVAENGASRRVIEKLGFRLLGEQRDHFFRFDRWWNHLVYELLVDDWRAG
jgi:RimJ/RimL family protein N-acetyltransferase